MANWKWNPVATLIHWLNDDQAQLKAMKDVHYGHAIYELEAKDIILELLPIKPKQLTSAVTSN